MFFLLSLALAYVYLGSQVHSDPEDLCPLGMTKPTPSPFACLPSSLRAGRDLRNNLSSQGCRLMLNPGLSLLRMGSPGVKQGAQKVSNHSLKPRAVLTPRDQQAFPYYPDADL